MELEGESNYDEMIHWGKTEIMRQLGLDEVTRVGPTIALLSL
jgi:hypothetical protein